ncbi:MAG: Rne/Rng family ribonuclease [Pseudomonadota bacterium]
MADVGPQIEGHSGGDKDQTRRPAHPSEQVLITRSGAETRVAVVAGTELQELHLTRSERPTRVGDIVIGRVVKILPGMQAAFVEVGFERPGFLHANDIEPRRFEADGAAATPQDIRKLVHEGQTLLVQINKDPISSKGARLTTNLTLPARWLVLTPFAGHVGISQRITDETERERLRALVAQAREQQGAGEHGFIVRTAAEGASAAALVADMQQLLAAWNDIRARPHDTGAAPDPGTVVWEELPVHVRVLRDLLLPEQARVVIDDAETHAAVRRFAADVVPALAPRIELHTDRRPLFDAYDIEAQIEAALKPTVSLPSGGYLVIEQTEAMITVDVNTGGFVGVDNLEDTVFRTNLEAARALPRQLRLRNLGGLIVVDFIDMLVDEHRQQLVAALNEALRGDTVKVRASDLSQFGLVELSRKRTRESLNQQLCEPCDRCGGTGLVKRPEIVAFEALRGLAREVRTLPAGGRVRLSAGPAVLDYLAGAGADHLRAAAERAGCSVELTARADARPDFYELAGRPDG